MAEQAKIDRKALDAITKKVLERMPNKKRESNVKLNHDADQEPHVRAKSN